MTTQLAHPAPWHRPLRCSANPKLNYDCFGLRDLGRGIIHHNGCDYYHKTLRKDDPVYAVDDGLVHEAGSSSANTAAGIHAGIHHADGFSRYLHLSRIFVQKGDQVTAGQLIGFCGNTGSARAPHLHFEWRTYKTRPFDPSRPGVQQGTPVDPVKALAEPLPSPPNVGDGMYAYLTLEILQATLDAGVWEAGGDDAQPETRAGLTFSKAVWYWGEQAERARRGLPSEPLKMLDAQVSAALGMNLS